MKEYREKIERQERRIIAALVVSAMVIFFGALYVIAHFIIKFW